MRKITLTAAAAFFASAYARGGDEPGNDVSAPSIMAFGAANDSLRADRFPLSFKRPNIRWVFTQVSENAGIQEAILFASESITPGLSGDTVGSGCSLGQIVVAAGRGAAGYRPSPIHRNTEGVCEGGVIDAPIRPLDTPTERGGRYDSG